MTEKVFVPIEIGGGGIHPFMLIPILHKALRLSQNSTFPPSAIYHPYSPPTPTPKSFQCPMKTTLYTESPHIHVLHTQSLVPLSLLLTDTTFTLQNITSAVCMCRRLVSSNCLPWSTFCETWVRVFNTLHTKITSPLYGNYVLSNVHRSK